MKREADGEGTVTTEQLHPRAPAALSAFRTVLPGARGDRETGLLL